ncbi:KR domain-containing protein, partial [Streptomyces albiaxialis]|uniref:KR domain-containing protein n=1 Tax=Streptomyces albiaxialis TaxID=329523 RepID=UPI0031E1DC52
GGQELVGRLTELGAGVEVVAADMSDPEAVKDLVAGIDPARPLTGVIHAAGILEDAVLSAQTPEGLTRVWGPKARAAYHLHHATAHLPLTHFVIFSSAAAAFGSPGQANYAAANAYCDALAAHRRALGLPGLSIGWGLWAEASGMSGGLGEADLARITRTGFRPLATERGLALFDAALARGRAGALAVDIDPGAALASGGQGDAPVRALLRTLAAGAARGPVRRTAANGRAASPAADLADRLVALPPDEQERLLLDLVRTNAASVLGHADAGAVRGDVPFKELGFDSLTVVELRNRLAAATGLRLPASLAFDYPEAGALAAHLRQRLAPDGAGPPGTGTGTRAGGSVDPLLTELGRIERGLSTLDLDDEARRLLARRLTGLLSAVDGGGAGAREEAGDGADTTFDGVESATDDEIFELIDREL